MDKQRTVQLERLRDKMVEAANIRQTLHDGEVLTLSQLLDQLILKEQLDKLRKRRAKRTFA